MTPSGYALLPVLAIATAVVFLLVFALLFVVAMYFIGGPMAWVPAVAIVLMVVVGLMLQPSLKSQSQTSQEDSQSKQAVLVETLHGLETIKALGAGAVMAGIGLTLLRRGRPPLWFLAASAAVLSVGTASLALVGHFGAAAALLVALGCCQILFSTGCNTTLQLETPDALRGRVMGLYALANAGMTPFGSILTGLIAERLGVRAACALGGGSGLVAVIVLVLLARRSGLAWTRPRER